MSDEARALAERMLLKYALVECEEKELARALLDALDRAEVADRKHLALVQNYINAVDRLAAERDRYKKMYEAAEDSERGHNFLFKQVAAERDRYREALCDVADWIKNNPEQEHAPLSDSGVVEYARAALEEKP